MLYQVTVLVRGLLQESPTSTLLKILMANYASIPNSRHQHRNPLSSADLTQTTGRHFTASLFLPVTAFLGVLATYCCSLHR